MKTLAALKTKFQQYHTVEELEQILNDIFESPEATDTEKRLYQGPHSRLFKTAAEELLPLIVWLKIRAPHAKAKLVLGNQNYDAVIDLGATDPTHLEIGLAVNGYQDRLMKEAITQDGHGSPNSTYARNGIRKEKSVRAANARITASSASIAEKLAEQIDQIAAKKSGKTYDPSTILILAQMDDFGIRNTSLAILISRAKEILTNYTWPVDRVDIIGKTNGLLASYSRFD